MRYSFIILLLSFFSGFAQEPVQLGYDNFLAVVRDHHPISLQAQLQNRLGETQVLSSKGGVDPKVFTSFSQKEFEDIDYYSQFNAGVKVPTWMGISFEAGYQQNTGVYLNPENTTPLNGQYYLGASLPVGRGLFMDERRAALRQAQVYAELTQAQQALMINDLILAAGVAYWEWYKTYANLKVIEDAYQIAHQRLKNVKQSAILGDRPMMDTLEAGIQKQTRLVQLNQTQMEYQNATAYIEVFLWQDGQFPARLDRGTVPSEWTATQVSADLTIRDSILLNHPEMERAQLKIDALEIKRRLSSEMLKPELNLKYNALSNNNLEQTSTFTNNYQFGLQFSMPIFLRKERGKLQQTKIQIEQSNYAMDQKQMELYTKALTTMNEFETISGLIDLQKQTVKDYLKLLEGEQTLFEGGESSLFMVNSREMSYFQSQLKLNALLSKWNQSSLKVKHAMGVLNSEF